MKKKKNFKELPISKAFARKIAQKTLREKFANETVNESILNLIGIKEPRKSKSKKEWIIPMTILGQRVVWRWGKSTLASLPKARLGKIRINVKTKKVKEHPEPSEVQKKISKVLKRHSRRL